MNSELRPKKKRKKDPSWWLQSNSLVTVASPFGGEPILTPTATNDCCEIFLNRLKQELIVSLKWNRQKEANTSKSIWRKRVIVGTNQCTKVLENALANEGATANPSLVVLAAQSTDPPIILSQIPVLARQFDDLPILHLRGNEFCKELRGLLGIRVSVLVFLQENAEDNKSAEDKQQHELITSFVQFVKDNLIPNSKRPT